MSEVAAHGPKARLELARDILNIRAKLGESPSVNMKHLAANRIKAIRRVLLGRPGAGLVDQLLSPSMGPGMIKRMAESAIESSDKPTPEIAAQMEYLGALGQGLTALSAAESRSGSRLGEGLSTVYRYVNDEVIDAMIDDCAARGRIEESIRARLPELVELVKKTGAAAHADLLAEHAPEVGEHLAAMRAESERLVAAYRAEAEAARIYVSENPGLTEAEQVERYKAYDEMYRAYVDHHNQHYRPVMDAAAEKVKEIRAQYQQPLIEAGKAFTDSLMQASPVTPEQATAWADAQEVTPQAKARLKKIGYDVAKLRQDMAEFYRLTGGRLVKVKIHSKGDRRANATGINDHGNEGVINLDGSFDKRVLWHELAHHIEADPVAKMQAGRMIRRRSVDGRAYSLRKLTGNNGYRSDESAYKDHFFSHYIGKIYRDGVTEVFSMGVESFSDPLTLAQRMAQDPETLEFVAGYLKQPIHPLARAHMTMRESLIDMKEQASEEQQGALEELIAQIAATVHMTPDTDDEWLKSTGYDYYVKGKQIGRFEGSNWYVFEGKVRNPETKRRVTGIMLVKLEKKEDQDASARFRYSLQQREYPFKDLAYAKVAMAAWQKTGVMPWPYEIQNEAYLRKILE